MEAPMLNFPTTVVDDFLPNPQLAIDYANSDKLNWAPDPYGKWPGMRSDNLLDADMPFFSYLWCRTLLLYFPQEQIENGNMRWRASAYFQRIQGKYDTGWIHSDHPNFLTLILYLTPNADPRCGTAFYKVKDWTKPLTSEQVKKDYYLGKITKEQQLEHQTNHNANFQRTGFVGNQFNRLLVFDSQLWHGVEEYKTGTDEERLTLICFIESLSSDTTPIARSKALSLFRNVPPVDLTKQNK